MKCAYGSRHSVGWAVRNGVVLGYVRWCVWTFCQRQQVTNIRSSSSHFKQEKKAFHVTRSLHFVLGAFFCGVAARVLVSLGLIGVIRPSWNYVPRYKDLLPKSIATGIICKFRLLPGNKVSAIQRGVVKRMDQVR